MTDEGSKSFAKKTHGRKLERNRTQEENTNQQLNHFVVVVRAPLKLIQTSIYRVLVFIMKTMAK